LSFNSAQYFYSSKIERFVVILRDRSLLRREESKRVDCSPSTFKCSPGNRTTALISLAPNELETARHTRWLAFDLSLRARVRDRRISFSILRKTFRFCVR